jgi:hypothetical protein
MTFQSSGINLSSDILVRLRRRRRRRQAGHEICSRDLSDPFIASPPPSLPLPKSGENPDHQHPAMKLGGRRTTQQGRCLLNLHLDGDAGQKRPSVRRKRRKRGKMKLSDFHDWRMNGFRFGTFLLGSFDRHYMRNE